MADLLGGGLGLGPFLILDQNRGTQIFHFGQKAGPHLTSRSGTASGYGLLLLKQQQHSYKVTIIFHAQEKVKGQQVVVQQITLDFLP